MPKKVCIHLEKVERIIKNFKINHSRSDSIINKDGNWETLWGVPSLILEVREGEFSVIAGDRSFIGSSSEYHSSKIRRCSSDGGKICEWDSSDNIVVSVDNVNKTASLLTNLKREIISVVEDCNCENAEDLRRKVGDLYGKNSNLTRNSVNKDEYNKLFERHEKDVKDYNDLREKYNNLVNKFNNLSENSIKDYNNLKDKYNKLVDEYNDKNTDYHNMKEKYEETNEKLHDEKLKHANEMGNEKLKHKDKSSLLDIKISRLEEKLEAANSDRIDLRRRLKDKEEESSRLLIKLDDKNNQLTVLRLESGKKNDEISKLKGQAKSSDKRAEKSQEELLNEKIRSEKGNLELLAAELRVGLEQTKNLIRYHERLFRARKNYNQANIETHENNITGVKEELQNAGISIVNIQEICRKCERIAELRWELEQNQQEFQAQQEVPTNN